MFDVIESDVLVVGGGGAGVRAAIEALRNKVRVLLVSKGRVAESGLSVMGGGGIAVVTGIDPKDSIESHFRDTVVYGHYLNDQNLVEVLVKEAPKRAWKELEAWGIKTQPSQYLHKVGHSHRRGLFVKGYTVMKHLKRELLRCSGVKIIEDCMVTRLITKNGKIAGATGLNIKNGEFMVFRAKSVVLATGGLGNIYSISTNSPHGLAGDASGTGFALAYHVGAELIDMEMTQFYPSVVVYPTVAKGLLFPYEIAVGMLGGRIYNAKGEEFLRATPLVRDIMAKKMVEEIRAGNCGKHGGVFIDLTKSQLDEENIEKTLRKYMFNYTHFKLLGIDFKRQPLEVRPAVHFSCGGVKINERTETNVPGLYAAGEVAGNVHGANRLAGNSFTDFLVFGARAGKYSAEYAKATETPEIDWEKVEEEHERIFKILESKSNGIRPIRLKRKIQAVMENYVGPLRSERGLIKALALLSFLKENYLYKMRVAKTPVYNLEWIEAIEASLMLDVAEIIVRSALLREESRGCHQREDHPKKDKALRHTSVKIERNMPELTMVPVKITRLNPEEDA